MSESTPQAARAVTSIGICVSEKYLVAVRNFVLRGELPHHLRGPLVLAVQGPSGEGKSYQTRKICEHLGLGIIELSGAELCGESEGAPVAVLSRYYIRASNAAGLQGKRQVLLIDDFDLSCAGVQGAREYTVNTQLLNGFLMNLCDNPEMCQGEPVRRTQIIVTGNLFTSLHPPLLRHGRAQLWNWHLTGEEGYAIAHSILRECCASHDPQFDIFLRQHVAQPIAFFWAIRDALVDRALTRLPSPPPSSSDSDFALWVMEQLKTTPPAALETIAAEILETKPEDYLSAPPNQAGRHGR